MSPAAAEDQICVCISRVIADGDILLEGIGAFLPTAGYELARKLHAPGAWGMSPVGSVFRREPVPMALDNYEASTLEVGLGRFSYADMALRYLPAYLSRARRSWKEFMRPAQVDTWGNTNNVVIGDYRHPTVRLPGAVGLPDGTVFEREIMMYVPRHDRRTFVEEVDFISTLGHRASRGAQTHGRRGNPTLLISDLGTFRFDPEAGLTCVTVHEGVRREDVIASTGCALEIAAVPDVTPPPTARELGVLRDEVDPAGLRRLEMVGGKARLSLLRELFLMSSPSGGLAKAHAT